MEDFNLEDFKKEVAKKIREGKGYNEKSRCLCATGSSILYVNQGFFKPLQPPL